MVLITTVESLQGLHLIIMSLNKYMDDELFGEKKNPKEFVTVEWACMVIVLKKKVY